MKKAILILGYLTCSYLNWGFTLGYFTHRFPEGWHVGIASLEAILGPVGTAVVLIEGTVHGRLYWRVAPMTKEESWEAFHQQWRTLSHDDFEMNY